MNLLVRLKVSVLREFAEILRKIHALRMILLLGSGDRTHLNIAVSYGMIFGKHHYLLVTEDHGFGDSEMDNAQDITFNDEHCHGSLELLAFIDAEIAYSYVKCIYNEV